MVGGEQDGRVVLFTGPTGCGKTTVAEAWATGRAMSTGFIDHDQTRLLLRAGYVSRSAAAADPALRRQADEQWLLAARVCEAVAREYSSSGVDLAVAAFRPPGEWMGCWSALDRMRPLIAVLLAPIEVALARDAGRIGRARTGEGSIRRAFTYDWQAWREHPDAVLIDNSGDDVQVAVQLVERAVRTRWGPTVELGAAPDDPGAVTQ